ncbi:MAG TPA: hypothetical protein ENN07_06380 [candidate division Zixibacteria bacterium]|nr:hypothetical protein [candidate division Zixibacteria bacterium]
MKIKHLALTLVIALLMAAMAFADDAPVKYRARQRPASMFVATDEKSHDVGQLHFTVSNWGFFGSQRGHDDPRYCIIYTEGENAGTCRPSAEYPGGSGIEYLFQGALWIGAVVGGDTLVSTGEDGWFHNINEIFPGYNQATDTIMHRSILTGDPEAISEQDFIAVMTDTVKNPDFVPSDHRPIGIEIKQRSVAWSYNYARNFIIIDYWFTNIREDMQTIRDVYIGIYIDGDVGHVDTPNYAQDDITGFLEYIIDDITGDTSWVNTAWLADNDGDPASDGRFDEFSATGALGVAVLRVGNTPLSELDYSYNWWVSNTNEDLDWGPYRREYASWGWDGTPETDRAKYQVMSNREFDYDQTEIVNHAAYPDYMTPPSEPFNLAEMLRGGYDTRFLFSFGPFTIEHGQTIPVAIAVMVAEDFHVDPRNVGMPPTGGSIPSGWDPSKFQFDQVGKSTEWVRTVYGFDPPEDTIPKYQGPVPPPRPPFFVETSDNKIEILWDPDTCINFFDGITNLYDFAGFRIYVGEANQERWYTPIAEYDKVLFRDFDEWGRETDIRFECIEARTDGNGVIHDQVLDWSLCLDTIVVWEGEVSRDSIFHRVPYGTNTGLPKDSVLIGGKWHYRHTLTHQRAGGDLYIAMTAYDYGQPTRELLSLESSKTTNYLWVVPRGKEETTEEVYVVPNPYRIDHDYSGRQGLDWETPVGRIWTEYERKVRFVNLPPNCIIRIYTLDGDLVQKIDHLDPIVGSSAEGEMVGGHDWNLINRNDQSIASGIYMFSVENCETGEYQLGKFVIIK